MAKLLLDKYEKIGDFAIAAKIWAFEPLHIEKESKRIMKEGGGSDES